MALTLFKLIIPCHTSYKLLVAACPFKVKLIRVIHLLDLLHSLPFRKKKKKHATFIKKPTVIAMPVIGRYIEQHLPAV
jgi:hypothetical protein